MAEGVTGPDRGPAKAPVIAGAANGSDTLPSVVILDRSVFNRSCIAASLTSHHLRHIHAHDHVRDVPPHIDCHLALFFRGYGDGDSDPISAEVHAAVARWPGVRTVLLVGNAGPETMAAIGRLACPLSAVVADDIAADLLLAVLRLTHQGYTVLPEPLLRAITERSGEQPGVGGEAISADRPLLATSTARQREVMRLLLMGLSNKHIAQRLTISESTVKVHIRAIMNLLNVENRTQIVARLMCASSEGHG